MNTQAESRVRLVSFLGTGNYEETNYQWEGHTLSTPFISHALASFIQADEVCILGTAQSWEKHGDAIVDRLSNWNVQRPPSNEYFPLGATPTELWKQFEQIKQVLRAPIGTRIVLDITHGFRSQPFFASAAATFIRAVDSQAADLQIVYGAFDAKQDNFTPIWDITPFVELVDWSHSLMLFLKTGRAATVAADTMKLGRELKKFWHQNGNVGEPPTLNQLGKAIETFGHDLETVRTGSLLLDKPGQPSSAKQLNNALNSTRESLVAQIPPLADVLDRIQQMVDCLIPTSRLSEASGQNALQQLGLLYWKMGRFSEAAATMREAWITRYACENADCPGDNSFSKHHRDAAEKAWFEANENLAREIGEFRNDIEHAGYRDKPISAVKIKQRIKELLDKLVPDE